MNEFSITILGNGSAVPTTWMNPSAQVVRYAGKQFLIDCGEGTQMQMIRYKIKSRNLDHIFISHLHGDHFYGLIGLINSFHLMRRTRPLNLYASAALKDLINFQLRITNTRLNYPLEFHALEKIGEGKIYEDKLLRIDAFPLKHSIPVWGFLFRETTGRVRLKKSFVSKYAPTVDEIGKIIDGSDFETDKGEKISNAKITLPPRKPRSFAYCSDTAFLVSTAGFVKGVDLLYHESTFDDASRDLAEMTLHSTASDAARVAKKAEAGKLLIGHYSARFKDLGTLLREAKEVFPDTELSIEGKSYHI